MIKEKKVKIVIIIYILLLLGAIPVETLLQCFSLNFNHKPVKIKIDIAKSSNPPPTSFQIPQYYFTNLKSHSPILIDGDEDFHQQSAIEGWDLKGTRDGSYSNPYVISGYVIRDNSEYLIAIRNTTLHFILYQNVLTNSSNMESPHEAISCINVTHGVIENNYIQGTKYYVSYLQMQTVPITEVCLISPSFKTSSQPNFIGTKIQSNGNIGLRCENSSLLIINNTISGFPVSIRVINSSALLIANNSLSHSYSSIDLDNSSNNFIINNSIIYSYQPIMIGGPIGSVCMNNTFLSNYLYDYFIAFTISIREYNKILNNTISTGYFGFYLMDTSNCVIEGNVILNVYFAIMVRPFLNDVGATPRYNRIAKNVIYHCNVGISLENAQNNTITKNIFFEQRYKGVNVRDRPDLPRGSLTKNFKPSWYNNISDNVFYNNSEGDLALYSNTAKNIVMLNKFLATTSLKPHISDNGSCNYIFLNYYYEWVSPDQNQDGIVDLPYQIAGSADNSDPYPLVSMNTTIDIGRFSDYFYECPTAFSTSFTFSFFYWSFIILGLAVFLAIVFTYFYLVSRRFK